jgi:hypothetical protein
VDNLQPRYQSDGVLHYRRDVDGEQVGIIPATCQVCGRSLHKVGFRVSQRDDVMFVDCGGCTTAGLPGHAWQFTAPKAAPIRVEFDDQPYIRR